MIDQGVGEEKQITDPDSAFGDALHGGRGAQVATGETRLFLDATLGLSGIRLPPDVGRCEPPGACELRGAVVDCARDG